MSRLAAALLLGLGSGCAHGLGDGLGDCLTGFSEVSVHYVGSALAQPGFEPGELHSIWEVVNPLGRPVKVSGWKVKGVFGAQPLEWAGPGAEVEVPARACRTLSLHGPAEPAQAVARGRHFAAEVTATIEEPGLTRGTWAYADDDRVHLPESLRVIVDRPHLTRHTDQTSFVFMLRLQNANPFPVRVSRVEGQPFIAREGLRALATREPLVVPAKGELSVGLPQEVSLRAVGGLTAQALRSTEEMVVDFKGSLTIAGATFPIREEQKFVRPVMDE